MFTKTKKRNDEFELLDEEIVSAIPSLQRRGGPGEPMLAAADLFYRLQAARKKILAELNTCSAPGPSGSPVVRYDASKDSEALLAGRPVEELCAPVQESHRASLLRQLRAVDGALPSAQSRIGELELQIIQAECSRLRPILEPFVRDTLDAAKHLLACLHAEKQLYELLSGRGFVGGRRPAWLDLWPQMLGWLLGDVHRPSLQRFIEDRSKAAGLGKDKSNVENT